MKENPVIAILCSDFHLSHKPPVARSAEPDWYAAMQRPLDELRSFQKEYGNVPIVCAGDLFDRWDSPPVLINWAINHLPRMYCIPGQHDLPYHGYDEIERSAYWTLAIIGKIEDISESTLVDDSLSLHPFPWGFDVHPMESGWDHTVNLAVIHSYIWTHGRQYPGAPDRLKVSKCKKALRGYDVAVFGDNHQSFLSNIFDKPHQVFNCGTLMRRSRNERDYKPCVGLLHSDGSVVRFLLDVSKDKFIEQREDDEHLLDERQLLDLREFVEELEGLGEDSLDFRAAVLRYVRLKESGLSREYENRVEAVLLQALESRG